MSIFGLFLLVLAVVAEEPEVEVKGGRLRGRFRTTKGGRNFSAFEGIPFAKPPLGPLRFKPPVPVESWEGVRDASKIHNVCPQRDIYRRSPIIEGEEDCLYLNVYTPQLDDGAEPVPVMIFFHGGGWLCGGGNSLWYGPGMMLDRDVVLVVPNYRLGALGFLSTGDEVSPGNNGMKDQNLAMKWVKDNIRAFGGDPDRISIFGESAGGASVQLHMISPLSKGLFNTAISQSGTAHCIWAVSPNDQTVRNSKILAEAFSCDTSSSASIVECLREIPANDLVAKDEIFMKWDTDPMIPFKPVVEPKVQGAFLTEHPIDAIKGGRVSQVPWIVGLNVNDGALRAAGIIANPHLMEELERDFDKLVPLSLEYDETSDNVEEITAKIKEFYLGDRRINETAKEPIVDMYTDGWFLHGADEAIRYHLKYSSQPIYYYLFGHRGVASFTEIFGDKNRDYGVCHADELQYLFPVGDGLFPDRAPSPADKKVARIMTTLWANFAAFGNPTPATDDLIPNRWLPVTSDQEMDNFFITSDGPVMKKNLFKERTQLWRSLPIRSKTKHIKDEL